MSSNSAPAPAVEPCSDGPCLRGRSPIPTTLPLAGLVAALLLFLVGCGNQNTSIDPSRSGNFVLQVSPEDAEVVVTRQGEDPESGRETSIATSDGVRHYDLGPGRYLVRVTRSGYAPIERMIEIPADYEAPGRVVEEIFLEPEAGVDNPPVDGDEGGSGLLPRYYAMRGDAEFSPNSLSSSQRDWYDRLWAAIENPDANPNADRLAASDNLYQYSREMHTHLQTLLTLFRATGDLKLLDEVDRLTAIMRSKLRDEWRDTNDGSNGERDGYINWVYRHGDSELYGGKDLHVTDETRTHSIIAQVAYALHLNRDLESPDGRDYSESADFWLDYLLNHFEAKWRERKGVPDGEYPFITKNHTHTYISSMKYHYYIYRLTGSEDALAEARRKAGMLWDNEFKLVSTSDGEAYVWARSILSEGEDQNYLHPSTYARYAFADFIDMHFEGFDNWADREELRRFATTFSRFVIDKADAESGDDWFARDIGGGKDRAGIPASSWERMDTDAYTRSPYPLLAAFDATGKIADISKDVLVFEGSPSEPKTVHVAAGMLLDAMVDD